MQTPGLLALIIFAATVIGAIAGVFATMLWQNWHSRRFRTLHDIPDLIGQWQCQWFDDAAESDKPKVEDTVEIWKWTSDGEFKAQGHQPQFHLSYPIVGEVDPSRTVTLIYKAARYPYEPNRGVVLMQLSRDGQTMEGRWYGRRFSNTFGGGKVRCSRVLGDTAVI